MSVETTKFYRKPIFLVMAVGAALAALLIGWIIWAGTVEAPGANEAPEASQESGGQELNREYIGLSEAEAAQMAEAEARPWRVVHRDGEDLPATMDLRPNRINFWIEDGEVFKALTDEEMAQDSAN